MTTLLRSLSGRWSRRPTVASVPIVFWLAGGLAYLIGWRVAGLVVQGLSLAFSVVLAVTRNRRDPWGSARNARRSLPLPEREALKGYPSWW
jgi:hypothetical protein